MADGAAGNGFGTGYGVVDVTDVAVHLPEQHATVTLHERDAPFRVMRFPIALTEAAALEAARLGEVGARPGTHELFTEALSRLRADVASLRITGRSGTVLLAELDLNGPGGLLTLPCRPSDGLVLAARQGVPAPVLVADALLDEVDG